MESVSRNSGNGFIEFFKREKGLCAPRNYSRRISASKTLIEHIDFYVELNGHKGTVNTVEFNSTGELLISSSDDGQLTLWEWETKKMIYSYPSGHFGDFTQAKILPFTDHRKIITSATDGQVRLIEVLDNGLCHSKHLSKQQGQVTCFAAEPGSPYNFYCCGYDGSVQHYDLRSCSATNLFHCTSVEECGVPIRMFSMVIDPRNPNYVALGGEDAFARVFDIRNFQANPSTNEGSPINVFCRRDYVPETDHSMIISLAYSTTSELLVSYTDHTIHLFQKNMAYPSIDSVCSSIGTSKFSQWEEQVYSGHRNWIIADTSKGVHFFGPNDEYIVSGSDCGRLFIWEKEGCELVRTLVGDSEIVYQVAPHPLLPVLASCGTECNVRIWSPSSSKPVNQLAEAEEGESDDEYSNDEYYNDEYSNDEYSNDEYSNDDDDIDTDPTLLLLR